MADLSEKNSAQSVKLVGADSSGVETNFIDVVSVNGLNCLPSVRVPIEMYWTHVSKGFLCYHQGNQPNAAERATVLIKNPTGSGIDLYFGKMVLDVLTKGGQCTYTIYKNPTVTANGTAITLSTLSIGSAYSPQTLAYSIPTTTSFGTRMMSISCGKDSNSMVLDFMYALEVEANNSILVTCTLEANNRDIAFSLFMAESGD